MRATIVFLFFLCIFGTWYATSIHYLAKIYCMEKGFNERATTFDSINRVNIQVHKKDSLNWEQLKMVHTKAQLK